MQGTKFAKCVTVFHAFAPSKTGRILGGLACFERVCFSRDVYFWKMASVVFAPEARKTLVGRENQVKEKLLLFETETFTGFISICQRT
jgi:hypothetical protein